MVVYWLIDITDIIVLCCSGIRWIFQWGELENNNCLVVTSIGLKN